MGPYGVPRKLVGCWHILNQHVRLHGCARLLVGTSLMTASQQYLKVASSRIAWGTPFLRRGVTGRRRVDIARHGEIIMSLLRSKCEAEDTKLYDSGSDRTYITTPHPTNIAFSVSGYPNGYESFQDCSSLRIEIRAFKSILPQEAYLAFSNPSPLGLKEFCYGISWWPCP